MDFKITDFIFGSMRKLRAFFELLRNAVLKSTNRTIK